MTNKTLFQGRKAPGNLKKLYRAGDRPLQLLVLNEEFLVSAGHQPALITSLLFVHTARRSYRLDGPVKITDAFEPRDGNILGLYNQMLS